MRIFRFKKIKSTNLKAEDLVLNKIEPPYVVKSIEQTNGQGRDGKNYYCPKGGLWFTLVLQIPGCPKPVYSLKLAYSIVKVLEKNGIKAKIKWPNDIYLNQKKIGGILIKKKEEYLYVGIGLNTNIKNFPYQLKQSSTSILKEINKELDNEYLFKEILKSIVKIDYKKESFKDYIKKYVLWINQKVSIENVNFKYQGIFKDIDKMGFIKIDDKIFMDGHLRRL